MRGPGTWPTFVWLISLLRDISPVYLLLAVLPAIDVYRRRGAVPAGAFVAFFTGVAIMNVFALFVGGMALADDWV